MSDKEGVTSDEAVKTIVASSSTHIVTFSVEDGQGGSLKAKPEGGTGSTTTATETVSVEHGTQVTFTATPAEGWEVDSWSNNVSVDSSNNKKATLSSVTGNTTVTVKFKKTTYKVTFMVDGANDTLTAKVDGTEIHSGDDVEKGKTVSFTATPEYGWEVKAWTLDGNAVNGTNSSYSFPVTKAAEVKVSFENTPPDVGSFEDTGDGFIKITPPAKGIVGVDPDYTLPGNEDKWKGVFPVGRKVKLSPYKLGKTEVTYKLWKEVYDWAVKAENGYKFANAGVKGSSGSGTDDEPVTTISWRDCIVWCNAYTEKEKGIDACVYRNKDNHDLVLKDATAEAACDAAYADMSKKGFRLPTEAEWEYAARWQGSNTTNAAQYGEVWLTKLNSASGAKDKWDTAETGEVAWYDGNSGSKTHPVGKKQENALKLHDMSGNVWEWCFDWYGDIEANTVTDPQGGASGTRRVSRGGSWYFGASYCTVGLRGYGSPDCRSSSLGFRLACRP